MRREVIIRRLRLRRPQPAPRHFWPGRLAPAPRAPCREGLFFLSGHGFSVFCFPPPPRVSVEAQLVTSCHQRPQASDLEYTEDEALIKTEDAVRKPEAQMVNMPRRVKTGNVTEILLFMFTQETIISLF